MFLRLTSTFITIAQARFIQQTKIISLGRMAVKSLSTSADKLSVKRNNPTITEDASESNKKAKLDIANKNSVKAFDDYTPLQRLTDALAAATFKANHANAKCVIHWMRMKDLRSNYILLLSVISILNHNN